MRRAAAAAALVRGRTAGGGLGPGRRRAAARASALAAVSLRVVPRVHQCEAIRLVYYLLVHRPRIVY